MLNGEKTGIGLAMEQYRYARREVNLKGRFNRGITTPLSWEFCQFKRI